MRAFLIHYRNILALVGALLVQLILLGYQVREQDDIRLLKIWVVNVINPVQESLSAITSGLEEVWDGYIMLSETQQENGTLRIEIAQLKLENQRYKEALSRFDREDELAAYMAEIDSHTAISHVIGYSSNPNSEEVFLNKGSAHGIKPGMAVITPDGVAGRIQLVYKRSSLARLISDREIGVGVQLEHSGVSGVMKGTGHSKECLIDYVRINAPVNVGETVYTSGEDLIYPKGLPVGTVLRTETGVEFQKIYLAPFSSLDELDAVLIIIAGVSEEIFKNSAHRQPKLLTSLPTSENATARDTRNLLGDQTKSELSTALDHIQKRYRHEATTQGRVIGRGNNRYAEPESNLSGSSHVSEQINTAEATDLEAPSHE